MEAKRAKKLAGALSACAALALCLAIAAPQGRFLTGPQGGERKLEYKGLERNYILFVPKSYSKDKPAPLVMYLHGGGSSAEQMQRASGFDRVAEREGILVAYPNAVENHWNDGRTISRYRSQRENIDDVGFLSAVIDDVSKTHAVDPKRVFAAGVSNGALMSNRLAVELSDRIAAIAPMIGGMSEQIAAKFKPSRPVSVIIIQGTEDPLVPYEGGSIRGPGGAPLGRVLPTEETARKWAAANGCKPEPERAELPDANPDDKCRVKTLRWSGGKEGTEVLLYVVEGGGHTTPGGLQYLPERVIGRVCRDFDANEALWEFFKRHGHR